MRRLLTAIAVHLAAIVGTAACLFALTLVFGVLVSMFGAVA